VTARAARWIGLAVAPVALVAAAAARPPCRRRAPDADRLAC
jgi:hypothetical protein